MNWTKNTVIAPERTVNALFGTVPNFCENCSLFQATQMPACPKRLDLSKGGLSRIPDSILAFPGVEEILLARNQLNNSDSNFDILDR